MKPFRWSRKTYKHAHHLARVLGFYDSGPEILERYRQLWIGHSAMHGDEDPLRWPLRDRLAYFRGDDVPF